MWPRGRKSLNWWFGDREIRRSCTKDYTKDRLGRSDVLQNVKLNPMNLVLSPYDTSNPKGHRHKLGLTCVRPWGSFKLSLRGKNQIFSNKGCLSMSGARGIQWNWFQVSTRLVSILHLFLDTFSGPHKHKYFFCLPKYTWSDSLFHAGFNGIGPVEKKMFP